MRREELLIGLENIEDNFKVLDNIFKCIQVYYKGESADAIADLYSCIKEDIDISSDFIKRLKSNLGSDNVRKLPGDIL